MKPTDVCSMCGTVNKKEWCLWHLGEKLVKTCKPCKEKNQGALNSFFYEKNKRRIEKERRENNDAVIRQIRNGTIQNPPGSR